MAIDRTTQRNHLSSKAKEKILDEGKRFAVIFFYLWALLLLFVLEEDIVLRARGINFTSQGFALLNALMLAKVMLLVEDLNPGRWLRQRPLIYPILQESVLLTVLFICFHIVEHVALGWFRGEPLAASVPHIGGGGIIGLLLVAAALFIALIPFFAFKYIAREIGKGKLRTMIFGTGSRDAAER
jgi:hypothetical protein